MKKLLLILAVSLFAGSAFAGNNTKTVDATKTNAGAAVVEQSAEAAKDSANKAAVDAKKAADKVSKKADEVKKDAKKY